MIEIISSIFLKTFATYLVSYDFFSKPKIRVIDYTLQGDIYLFLSLYVYFNHLFFPEASNKSCPFCLQNKFDFRRHSSYYRFSLSLSFSPSLLLLELTETKKEIALTNLIAGYVYLYFFIRSIPIRSSNDGWAVCYGISPSTS